MTAANALSYVSKNYDVAVNTSATLTGIGNVGYGYMYNRYNGSYNIQHYYDMQNQRLYERLLVSSNDKNWVGIALTSNIQSGTVILGTIPPNSLKGVTVNFAKPMPNINYDVSATQYLVASASEHVTLYTSDYTVNGFKLSGYNSGTRETGSIKARWIALSSK